MQEIDRNSIAKYEMAKKLIEKLLRSNEELSKIESYDIFHYALWDSSEYDWGSPQVDSMERYELEIGETYRNGTIVSHTYDAKLNRYEIETVYNELDMLAYHLNGIKYDNEDFARKCKGNVTTENIVEYTCRVVKRIADWKRGCSDLSKPIEKMLTWREAKKIIREIDKTVPKNVIKLSDNTAKDANLFEILTYVEKIEHPEKSLYGLLNFRLEQMNEIYKKMGENRMLGVAHMKDDSYKVFYIGSIEEGKNDLSNLDIVDRKFDKEVDEYYAVVSRNHGKDVELATKKDIWKPYDMQKQIEKFGLEVATWKEKCREAIPERSVLPEASKNYRKIVKEFKTSVNKVKDVSEIFDAQEYFRQKGWLKNIHGTVYESAELEGTGIGVLNIPKDKESLSILAKEKGYAPADEKNDLLETVKAIIPDFFKNEKLVNKRVLVMEESAKAKMSGEMYQEQMILKKVKQQKM